jgi:hypothetical protein
MVKSRIIEGQSLPMATFNSCSNVNVANVPLSLGILGGVP